MVPVKRCDGVCIIYLHSTARLPICVPNIGRRRVIEEGKLIRDEAVERPHSFALGSLRVRMDDSSLPPKRPPRPRLGLRAQGFAVLLFHAVVVTKRDGRLVATLRRLGLEPLCVVNDRAELVLCAQ